MITSCLERNGGLMWFSDSLPEDRQIQEEEQRQTAEDAPHSVQPPPVCEQTLRFRRPSIECRTEQPLVGGQAVIDLLSSPT